MPIEIFNNIPPAPQVAFDEKIKAWTTVPFVSVKGLAYFPNAITAEEEQQLLEHIDAQPFSEVLHRRQQFYGERYFHTTYDVADLQPAEAERVADCLDMKPMQWLIDRLYSLQKQSGVTVFGEDPDKAPTQILVNEYVGPMGILNHFDDENAFGEVIVTVSLGQPVWMNLTLPQVKQNNCMQLLESQRILLEPRSVLIMRDDVRYEWRHGISKSRYVWCPYRNEYLYRDQNYRRISLTIRKLLQGRKRVVAS